MEQLTKEEISTAINNLSGWRYEDNALVKNFVFKDFKETLSYMMGIGIIAEDMNHHPEWFNVYNKLDIRLTTHDADGVTQKDIDLATKIEEILKQ